MDGGLFSRPPTYFPAFDIAAIDAVLVPPPVMHLLLAFARSATKRHAVTRSHSLGAQPGSFHF
jgi:hypothetical protein